MVLEGFLTTTLTEAVRQAADEAGRLPCQDAMALAERARVGPRAIGAAADAAGVKLSRCQLGLFGYGRSRTPDQAQSPAETTLPQPLMEHLSGLERREITCAAAWALADGLQVERLAVGQAAKALGVRINSCQLGCF
jgi:hypothetical protein